MANWANPTLTSTYTNFVTEVKDRDIDAAVAFDPAVVTVTSPPTSTVRWNSAGGNWQIWSGAAWGALISKYMIDVDTVDGFSANATSTATTIPVRNASAKLEGCNVTTGVDGVLPVANGGTNISTYTTGDILYASGAGTVAKLADVATGSVLLSGGVGVAPSYGQVPLTTHVSGVLPVANGGTNLSTYTTGDILYASGAGVVAKLADVAVGSVLLSGGVGVAPSYGQVPLTSHVSGVLPVANGGTGSSSGITVTDKIQSTTATQSGGALTLSLNPTTLDFRSATLTTGVPATRSVSAAISLVVPSGATLGTVSTIAARLILVAIDNAGTVELAVVNIAGGNDLSETGLISTTAINTASDSADVFYSTTARTNVPYRVVGAIDAVNTTGAWGNPTLVQGYGGQALAAMSSLGYGQTWQSLTGSRAFSTTYYNTTGKPIGVTVCVSVSISSATLTIGTTASYAQPGTSTISTLFGIVPAGGSYSCTYAGTLNQWSELR